MDSKDVEKIYNLAKLSLEDKDVTVISNKFNLVLDFIEEIFDVDTSDVEMTEKIDAHKAIFRKDEPKKSLDREVALSNAKDVEYGYYKLDWKI